MPTEWLLPLLTVFASIASTLGVAWLTGLFNKPVVDATARQQIPANAAGAVADGAADVATASASLVDRMATQMAKTDERVAALENTVSGQVKTIAILESAKAMHTRQIQFLTDRVATLTTGVRVLSDQITEMGGEPKWRDTGSGSNMDGGNHGVVG